MRLRAGKRGRNCERHLFFQLVEQQHSDPQKSLEKQFSSKRQKVKNKVNIKQNLFLKKKWLLYKLS